MNVFHVKKAKDKQNIATSKVKLLKLQVKFGTEKGISVD